MRKYETIKDIDTIKRMAIAGWPITVDEKGVLYANMSVYVLEDDQVYDWRNLFEYEVKILDPEITLEEARERIKSGVVYASSKHFSLSYCQVTNFNYHTGTISYRDSANLENKVFQEDCTFYPFDPTPFADLLEEVEEEKADDRPELFHFKGNFDDDSNYLNGHLEYIYSELDDIKKSIKSIHDNDFESVALITKLLTARIEALEGRKPVHVPAPVYGALEGKN